MSSKLLCFQLVSISTATCLVHSTFKLSLEIQSGGKITGSAAIVAAGNEKSVSCLLG